MAVTIKITGIKKAEKNIIKKLKKAIADASKDYQKETVKIVKDTIQQKNLVDKGTLIKSIQSKVIVKNDEVDIEVFSTDPKAKFLEDGTKHIGAFKFMAESAKKIAKEAPGKLKKLMKLK